jgi:signal transduction histidine kinase
MAARNPEQERAGVFLRYYPVLQRSSERLDRLVANLLETSKISSGASDVNAQQENLKVLLVEVREHLLPEAALKGIDIVLDISEGPTDLYFDREKTRIVMINLLSNAIRFSPVNGQILVGCTEEADDVQIAVLDNGPGIPRADVPHIFDRFFRSSSRLIRNTSGTGMGLYLSKALVEMQGGHIAILSEPGKGTNVTFSLPRSRA